MNIHPPALSSHEIHFLTFARVSEHALLRKTRKVYEASAKIVSLSGYNSINARRQQKVRSCQKHARIFEFSSYSTRINFSYMFCPANPG